MRRRSTPPGSAKSSESRTPVPPGAGVGSAIGFLRAPFGFESVRSAYSCLSRFEAKAINTTISDLVAEATSFVRSGAPDADPDLECTAYMRYVGQGWEVPVTIEVRDYVDDDGALFRNAVRRTVRTLLRPRDRWPRRRDRQLVAARHLQGRPRLNAIGKTVKGAAATVAARAKFSMPGRQLPEGLDRLAL